MSTAELVPVENAPSAIQNLATTLLDVPCCEPRIVGARNYRSLGTDSIWEVEIAHELIALDEDDHPYRHGRRTLVRIESFGG